MEMELIVDSHEVGKKVYGRNNGLTELETLCGWFKFKKDLPYIQMS